jgi:hypothetical protein
MLSRTHNGLETIQKMAITIVVIAIAISVMGLFSNVPGDSQWQASALGALEMGQL